MRRWKSETMGRTIPAEVSYEPNKNNNKTEGRSPPRQPGTPRPGSQVHGPKTKNQPQQTRDFKDKSWYALTYKEVPWTML